MTALLNAWFQFDLGEGAFYAVFGFLFVFVGIAVIVLIFTLLGLLMKKVNERRGKRVAPAAPQAPKERRELRASPALPAASEEGIAPEIIAVIAAALAAYYEEKAAKCDFVVRRIRRL